MQLAIEMLRNAAGRPLPSNSGCIADFERLVSQTMAAAAKHPVIERDAIKSRTFTTSRTTLC
jgi:hypothetical protein